ncbi:hypothetical protein [Aeromicrobium sp. Leaf350]|uniref:hypothetical protein n=1 Tax=Aeromicrobium sp. Leaf350 TaxID=2876565 RepID=UPI001E628597|nr:hypothetical protein [Aeromicrobium sp. Leaf350]
MEPYPAGPEQPYVPPTKGPAPASVQTAVKLIWVNVGLSVLSTILTIVFLDDLVHDLVNGGDGTISDDTARVSVIVGAVVGIAFGVGIAILFIYFLNKGANWARIVYSVLTGLGILFGIYGLFGSQPVALLLLGIVSLVVSVAVLVFLWRPDSNAFYTAPQPR